MKTLRVLHIVTSLEPGGLENGVCHLAHGLSSAGIETHLACLERSGAFAARLTANQQPTILGKRNGFSIRAVLTLFRLLRRIQPHLIHTHNLGPLIYALIATAGGRTRPILHGEHSRLSPEELTPRRRRQRKWAYRGIRHLQTVSKQQLSDYTALGVSPAQMTAIPNGVDETRFTPGDRLAARAAWGLGKAGPWLALVGRFGPHKRHLVLLEAFRLILQEFPETVLLFIGNGGSEEARFRAQVAEHPHRSQIVLTGYRADLPTIYPALDWLVVPSVNEGLSNVVLESMACGVPVLANFGAGLEEIITSGVNGLVGDLNTPVALAAQVVQCLRQPAVREAWSARARQTVTAQFSMTAMLESYARLYRRFAR